MQLIRTAQIRGGVCSMEGGWAAHVEDRGFRSIDFRFGVERKDVYKDPAPVHTGDVIRVTISDGLIRESPWARWFGRPPIKRISFFRATVINGWMQTRNYTWYVTFKPMFEYGSSEHDDFSIDLGTKRLPFRLGSEVQIVIDLVCQAPERQENIFDNYTYST